jgi:actin related protein 2/3 complex subunit 1A/1B
MLASQSSQGPLSNGLTASRVAPGLACFAFNKDMTKAAICPNNNEIWIYLTNNAPADTTKWQRVQVLKEHLNPVSALDWNVKTGLLLSASTDRGVIVWEEAADIKGLKPQLAVIKESKSNVDASWNHLGTKFCVGASSGNVFVGLFDPA